MAGGRPQGSPLRKRYKGCGKAGGVEPRPYKIVTRGAGKRADVGIGPYRRLLMVPCAAGHMGPALQGIFVGQGPRALPGVRYKVGGWDL